MMTDFNTYYLLFPIPSHVYILDHNNNRPIKTIFNISHHLQCIATPYHLILSLIHRTLFESPSTPRLPLIRDIPPPPPGSRRPIDVMDCKTQQVSTMTMKEFTTYYLLPTHARQLNVLSLEFSSTRLATYVDPPAVVRQIDWINTSWPAYLKLDQTDGTNLLDTMMYPKVQKLAPPELWSISGLLMI